ncbi:unnamed protein product [Bemisia tabaci]|uniref:Uncharacterized protein n=1 Tax=Bemisia tabaci TaxID=7038 RepID=A0A9P0CDH0_BEMTA|nr:unnamed protein product [Bemisia tabaci]
MLECHGAMCRTVLLLFLVYQFSKGMEQPQVPQGPEQQFNQLLQNQGLGYLVAANADPDQLEARDCIKECHQSFGFVYARQRNNWIPVATGTILIGDPFSRTNASAS